MLNVICRGAVHIIDLALHTVLSNPVLLLAAALAFHGTGGSGSASSLYHLTAASSSSSSAAAAVIDRSHDTCDAVRRDNALSDTPDRMFWFVQISDIHISTLRADQADQLRRFVEHTLPIVQPFVVIATGDLTDARRGNPFRERAGQIRKEWETYHSILEANGVLRPDFWLDMRGNHDSFAVSGDHDDLHMQFSSQHQRKGAVPPADDTDSKHITANTPSWLRHRIVERTAHEDARHYTHVFDFPFGRYRFISIDAIPKRAPLRHFFGTFPAASVDYLQQQLRVDPSSTNHTIVFGHFPLSTTSTDHPSGVSILEVLQQSVVPVIAYLCGHLHTLGGAVNSLVARHSRGLLELEVGDFKGGCKQSGVCPVISHESCGWCMLVQSPSAIASCPLIMTYSASPTPHWTRFLWSTLLAPRAPRFCHSTSPGISCVAPLIFAS